MERIKIAFGPLLIPLFLITLSLPPLSCRTEQAFNPYKIDVSSLCADKNPALHANLARGKYVVGFLSPSCQHCKEIVRVMHEMKEKNPNFPFYILLDCGAIGSPETADSKDFQRQLQASNIPYTCLDIQSFMTKTGGAFPLVVLVNNSWVEASSNYHVPAEADIRKWLQ